MWPERFLQVQGTGLLLGVGWGIASTQGGACTGVCELVYYGRVCTCYMHAHGCTCAHVSTSWVL